MEKKDKYQEQEDSLELENEKVDGDLENKPQKDFYGGIETEEYDILPELDPHEELADELSKKVGIELDYSFNGSEVEEALSIYQAATLLKKNLIYSCILLAVFFAYMVNIIKNPDEMFSVFLAVMCIAVLGFIWILPKLHIKKTSKAADLEEMKFTMTVYDNCIKIGEQNGSYIVAFNKEITTVFETPNLYLICAGKERLFILPKRCVPRETNEELKNILQSAMKDKYIEK